MIYLMTMNKEKTITASLILVLAVTVGGIDSVYAETLTPEQIQKTITQASTLKNTIDQKQTEFDTLLDSLNENGVFLPDQDESVVIAWQQAEDDDTEIGTQNCPSCSVKYVKVKAAYKHTVNTAGILWTQHVKGVWGSDATTGGISTASVEIADASVNLKPYWIVKKGTNSAGVVATFTGNTALQDSSNVNLSIIGAVSSDTTGTKTFNWAWDRYTSPDGTTQAQIAAGNFVSAELIVASAT